MNKYFANYEQSLELKQLGFNEPCFGYYRKDAVVGNPFEYNIDYCTKAELDHGLCPKNSEFINDWVAAPLKSQVFEWFRDKHKLYHTINMFGDWDKPQYSYIVSGRTMNNPAHMWHFEDKYSHEEAEDACIDKLIEIVKQKQNG